MKLATQVHTDRNYPEDAYVCVRIALIHATNPRLEAKLDVFNNLPCYDRPGDPDFEAAVAVSSWEDGE